MKNLRKLIPWLVLFAVLIYVGCDKVNNPQYHVDNTSCNECGRCIQICPVDAIEFGVDGKAIIDQTKCNQCGKCITICPKDAIY
jgi:ferredoxin